MVKDSNITAERLVEKLSIGIATVKRKIKKLKEEGKIERIGSDKTGYRKVCK
jgi:predicted HTH transcriptional regulator